MVLCFCEPSSIPVSCVFQIVFKFLIIKYFGFLGVLTYVSTFTFLWWFCCFKSEHSFLCASVSDPHQADGKFDTTGSIILIISGNSKLFLFVIVLSCEASIVNQHMANLHSD